MTSAVAIRSAHGRRRVSVPILMYHQVTPSPAPQFRKYAVTTEAFDRQLEWLAAQGFVSVSMEAFYRHRSGSDSLPPRPVILTFDDGYQDCLDHAAPILKSRGFTATFYVLGRLAGQTTRWLVEERNLEIPLLHWDGVRELLAAGHECGSHGMSHPHLTQIDTAACRDELRSSRHVLEDELGREIRHLAYPFGDYDERVRAIAADSGYHTACSVRLGWSPPDDDLLALHRIHVIGGASLERFADRFRRHRGPGELLRDGLRSLRRRLRSRR